MTPGRGQTPRGVANLIDDLRGLEIPAEAKLTGGAERATDGTAGLTGDAERMPLAVQRPTGTGITACRIVHQDGLHERPARESVRSLGLKRIHHSVVVQDNAVNRGYINRATHLLTVENVTDKEVTGNDD